MYKTFICIGLLTIAAGVINSQAIESLTDARLSMASGYKYIITDCYSSAGGKYEKYLVNDYTRNVDGSISFNTPDGKSKTIPYPYFSVNTADGNLILY